jgi:hypothetical protein
MLPAKIQHGVGFSHLPRAAQNERFAVAPVFPLQQLLGDKTFHASEFIRIKIDFKITR